MAKKNNDCDCNSGLPYKYCCIAKEPRKREMTFILDAMKKVGVKIDLTNDMVNVSSGIQLPLKFFCKDFEFYFFGIISLELCGGLFDKLISKKITKQDVFDAYRNELNEGYAELLFQRAFNEMEAFKIREPIIKSALKAHYNKDYYMSIPALFALLEGVLRDFGGLKKEDKFKPTIPVKIWDESGMYFVEDDAKNFNYFVYKLFEGGKDEDTFNRNPILHGFNVSYYSEEHSLLLILSLLEIRIFSEWSKHLGVFPKQVQETLIKSFAGHELIVGSKYSMKIGGISHEMEIVGVE